MTANRRWRITSRLPTSMIGLCQEAKSSPDALREERGCKFFSAFSASWWPLGDGSYSCIEQGFHLLVLLDRLHISLSLCFPASLETYQREHRDFVFSYPVGLTARPGR